MADHGMVKTGPDDATRGSIVMPALYVRALYAAIERQHAAGWPEGIDPELKSLLGAISATVPHYEKPTPCPACGRPLAECPHGREQHRRQVEARDAGAVQREYRQTHDQWGEETPPHPGWGSR